MRMYRRGVLSLIAVLWITSSIAEAKGPNDFNDEFDEKELAKEWTWEAKPDESSGSHGLTIKPGFLTLEAAIETSIGHVSHHSASRTGGRPSHPWTREKGLVIQREIPAGDMAVTAKIRSPKTNGYFRCGVFIKADDVNFLLATWSCTGSTKGTLDLRGNYAFKRGKSRGGGRYRGLSLPYDGTEVYIKLVRSSKNGIYMQYSVDGKDYTTVGRLPARVLDRYNATTTVGLFASSAKGQGRTLHARITPTETARVEFDSVRLAYGEPETFVIQNSVEAGDLIIDPPTFHNLGFRWLIKGDDNKDATVAVKFRETGKPNWRKSMALVPIRNWPTIDIMTSGHMAPAHSFSWCW